MTTLGVMALTVGMTALVACGGGDRAKILQVMQHRLVSLADQCDACPDWACYEAASKAGGDFFQKELFVFYPEAELPTELAQLRDGYLQRCLKEQFKRFEPATP